MDLPDDCVAEEINGFPALRNPKTDRALCNVSYAEFVGYEGKMPVFSFSRQGEDPDILAEALLNWMEGRDPPLVLRSFSWFS